MVLSDSLRNPAIISVEIVQSGILFFIASILDKYHSRVYFLFISFSILSLPELYRQMYAFANIWSLSYNVNKLIRNIFGVNVANLIRNNGLTSATISIRFQKCIVSWSFFHKYEFTFCPKV